MFVSADERRPKQQVVRSFILAWPTMHAVGGSSPAGGGKYNAVSLASAQTYFHCLLFQARAGQVLAAFLLNIRTPSYV